MFDGDNGNPQAVRTLEGPVAADLHDPGPGGMVGEKVLDGFAEVAAAAGIQDDVHGEGDLRGMGPPPGWPVGKPFPRNSRRGGERVGTPTHA